MATSLYSLESSRGISGAINLQIHSSTTAIKGQKYILVISLETFWKRKCCCYKKGSSIFKHVKTMFRNPKVENHFDVSFPENDIKTQLQLFWQTEPPASPMLYRGAAGAELYLLLLSRNTANREDRWRCPVGCETIARSRGRVGNKSPTCLPLSDNRAAKIGWRCQLKHDEEMGRPNKQLLHQPATATAALSGSLGRGWPSEKRKLRRKRIFLYWCFYVQFYCLFNGFLKEVAVIGVDDWRRIFVVKSCTQGKGDRRSGKSICWSNITRLVVWLNTLEIICQSVENVRLLKFLHIKIFRPVMHEVTCVAMNQNNL